ncbi:MAG: hypothetical protein ACUVWV_09825 [Thermodesulfobacteriota bacterium]
MVKRETNQRTNPQKSKDLFGADLYCWKEPFGADLYAQRPVFSPEYYCDINSKIIYG